MNFTNFLGTPHFHAVCAVLVSTAAIEALIAIWAAISRVHWFWRALAVWAGVTVLLPIRAYQPALVFALTSPVTIALIHAIKAYCAPRLEPAIPNNPRLRHFRFGLRDLLLATAVIGLALAGLLHLWPRLGEVHFAEFTLTAIAQTAIPTLALASLTTKRPWMCYAAMLAVILGVSSAVHFMKPGVIADWALVGVLFDGSWSWRFHEIQVAAIAASELALLLLAALRASLCLRERVAAEGSRVRAVHVPLLLLSTFWLLCLVIIYVNMLWLRPLPPPFSTQTNNYRRIIEISQRMMQLEKAGFPPASIPERQALIDEAIQLADAANSVPYELSDKVIWHDWNSRFIGPAQNLRSLVRTIDAEAAAAPPRAETKRACELEITNVRLGLMLQRGGTVVEYLIGIAAQSIANTRLIALREKMTPSHSRDVIAAWERALAEVEDLNSVINRDAAISERAYGWAARLANILDWTGLPNVYSSVREACLRRDATAHLLQADLAIRLYRYEHGRLPANLDDLVPAYLPTLPLDPYSNQPLIYRTNGDEYTLYSVGLDRIDNGGKFSNMRTYYSRDAFDNIVSGYDYDLDTATRP